MDFKINILDEHNLKIWDDFVLNNEQSTFYHQAGWMKVIEDTYGHKPYYFFASDNEGNIQGILPMVYMKSLFFGKRFISLPFSPYGGVCSNFDLVKKKLTNNATNMLNVDCCEIRNLCDETPSCIDSFLTFQLELSGGCDHIWKTMDKKKRNRVRKGEKSGLKFIISSNPESINDFYNIYATNMARLGTPVHNILFFRKIHEYFPSNVLIANVLLNDKNISSLYLLTFKDTLISGWGASISEHLNLAPNDFIYWNVIKYACENNYLLFDFGRSLLNSNTCRFKKRWGAHEIPLHYHYYPASHTQQPAQQKYSNLAKIWSKLPLSLTKKIGPGIRRHIP